MLEKDLLEIIAKEGNGKKFTYKGYYCEIIRQQRFGYLCGYVDLPKGHVAYGADYDDLDVDVHGGLTYSEKEKEGVYRVGFDCAHGSDLSLNDFKYSMLDRKEYRCMSYVEKEVKSLVDQLDKLNK